jgi:hypothetical protein
LKPFNIISLIVIMLVFSSVQFIGCLVLPLQQAYLTCLGWSKLVCRKHNLLVLTGASTLCWAIWLTRNDFVFNKSQKQTFLQELFWGTYWLRFWTQLQRFDEHKTFIVEACRLLESNAMFSFVSHG